jgi:hypothetical protein
VFNFCYDALTALQRVVEDITNLEKLPVINGSAKVVPEALLIN